MSDQMQVSETKKTKDHVTLNDFVKATLSLAADKN